MQCGDLRHAVLHHPARLLAFRHPITKQLLALAPRSAA